MNGSCIHLRMDAFKYVQVCVCTMGRIFKWEGGLEKSCGNCSNACTCFFFVCLFIAALFITAKNWKQSRYPSVGEWINE